MNDFSALILKLLVADSKMKQHEFSTDLLKLDKSKREFKAAHTALLSAIAALQKERDEAVAYANNLVEQIMGKETITISEAVKRLIEWAKPNFDGEITSTYQSDEWWWQIDDSGNEPDTPAWLKAIHDGKYTPAAIEEGLRDLFVTLLGGTDGNDNEPKN